MSGKMLLMPWVICLATAFWFGWMARSAGRNWVLWALGGGSFALVVSTIVLGLAHAGAIPMSHNGKMLVDLGSSALAAVLVLLLGWFFTENLHGHHRSILARLRERLGRGSAKT